MADTGATFPSLGSTEDRDGKPLWSNPTYIQAEANYAVCSVSGETYSGWLRASSFGFAIPSGATIDGIKVEISRCSPTAGVIKDSSLRLVDASGTNVGDDKASASYWLIDQTTATYGDASDTWGASPTPAMVNDSDFGIRLSAANTDGYSHAAYVYWVKITVYYTEAEAPTVDTLAVTDIGSVSFTGNADITDDGGLTVTRRGFVHAEGLKYALDFNGISDYVEIPYLADYYSNTAAVETFEWGSDTDPLSDSGGSVTWTITAAGTSKAEIDDAVGVPYQGTRCARLYRDGTNRSTAYFSKSPLTSTQSIEFWIRKDDTSYFILGHGDGSYTIQMGIRTDEKVFYNDGSEKTTGSTVSINTKYLLSIRNVNWVAHTYDIYLNGSIEKSGAVMLFQPWNNGIMAFLNNAGTSEVWIDNILVGSPSVWTFETWINRKVDSGTYETIMRYIGDAEVTDRFIQISATDIVQSGFVDTTGTNRYVGTIDTIPLNTETHLVTTFDGTFVKIYFDGVLKATSADLSAYIPRNNKLPIKIGKMLVSYPGLDGTQDDIHIWNDVRTQDEIQANMYAELVGTEAGLVGYWKLNEGVDATAGDSTANANDGTITGADWVYQSWDLKTMEDDVEQMAYDTAGIIYGGVTKRGQKLPILNGFVDSLSFVLSKVGSPSGDVTFTIRDLDDNILGSKVWGDASSLQAAATLEEAVFASSIPVNEWVRISAEYSGGDSSNYVLVWYQIGDVTPIGYRTRYFASWIDTTGDDCAYVLGYTPTTYEDGSFGEGEYSLTISSLTPSTWYRVRGFAVNSAGIGYGDIVAAQTLAFAIIEGSGIFSGIGTILSEGLITILGEGTISGIGTMLSSGLFVIPTSGVISGEGLIVSGGKLLIPGGGQIYGEGEFISSGNLIIFSQGEVVGIGIILSSGEVFAIVSGSAVFIGEGLILSDGAAWYCQPLSVPIARLSPVRVPIERVSLKRTSISWLSPKRVPVSRFPVKRTPIERVLSKEIPESEVPICREVKR